MWCRHRHRYTSFHQWLCNYWNSKIWNGYGNITSFHTRWVGLKLLSCHERMPYSDLTSAFYPNEQSSRIDDKGVRLGEGFCDFRCTLYRNIWELAELGLLFWLFSFHCQIGSAERSGCAAILGRLFVVWLRFYDRMSYNCIFHLIFPLTNRMSAIWGNLMGISWVFSVQKTFFMKWVMCRKSTAYFNG